MPLCDICDDLWRLLSEPDGESKTINLGSLDNALASKCPDHTKIIQEFKNLGPGIVIRSARQASDDVGFRGDRSDCSVTLIESLQKGGHVWELIAVKKEEVERHPGVGRILDPEWMDLEVVKRWKRKCLDSHGDGCRNPLKVPTTAPSWLLDVERKCLVPGSESKDYVALSYRSADDAIPTFSPAQLQQDGALDNPKISAQLPPKVRDAISLTSALGERYLWADFLCFDSHDSNAAVDQLGLMSSIYASALFTIIAADGNRADGINGLKNISQPRILKQRIFSIGDEKVVVRNTNIFSLENFHEYHKRGWTYQEFKMSPRKLLFMQGEVHWQCSHSVWHEELTLGNEVGKYIDSRPLVISAGFPDLGSLTHMLSNYNNRELTHDEDALAAITGLLTVFSRTFEGGFLYGLPETLFDRALAWMPQWPSENLRKRENSEKDSRIGFTDTKCPSWSWVAWQGMITDRYGEAVRINPRQYWMEEITPITEWYTSSAPTGKPKRRIRSTWFEKRDHRKDLKQPLPEGWIRLPAPASGDLTDDPMLYPDGCGKFVYRHHAMPDTDCDTWYYPFDVPEISQSTASFMPEQTRYLFCKTWKVLLWSHRTPDDRFENDHILTLRKHPLAPMIGKLHLQNEEQLDLWPPPSPGTSDPPEEESGRRIELIAINRCVHHAKTFNEGLGRYSHPLKREERITVLWVEWQDGVAYRLACGWVGKEAWDGLDPEAIDLVLG